MATHISTHTTQVVHVPPYDPTLSAHSDLTAASRAAHEAVASGQEPDQGAVDAGAAQLWGLSAEEVASTREFLDRWLKRDLRAD